MLNYIKIGNGPKVMIAFHGFGRDAHMFKGFEKVFPNYTIYSISLYYHGSEWKYKNQPMNEEIWSNTFRGFLAAHDITHFSLLGYSLGGKVALYTYQLFSEQVDRIELIAPYGIKSSIVEHLTQKVPFLYRRLEKYVHQPAFFFNLLEVMQKYKVVNRTILEITKKQMNSQETRFRAYHTMLLYGAIQLDLQEISSKIKTSGNPITFYLGHYDRILTLNSLNKVVGNLLNFSLFMLPTGHSSLPDKVAKILHENSESVFQKKPAYGLI